MRHLTVAQAVLSGGRLTSTAAQALAEADEGLRAAQHSLEHLVGLEVPAPLPRPGADEAMAAVLPTAILTTDRHGAVLRANRAALRLLELGQSSLFHKPLFALMDPERRRVARRMLSQAVISGQATDLQLDLRLRSGQALSCHAWLTPHHTGDSTGRPEVAAVRWVLERDGSTHGEGAAHAALVELCRLGVVDADLRSMLSRVVRLAAAAVPGVDDASVVLGDPDSPAVVAASSAQAQSVDGLQVLSGEGPTADAFHGRCAVLVQDLASDLRWPELSTRAPGARVRSVLALPLHLDGQAEADDLVPGGVLTLYGSGVGALGLPVTDEAVRPFAAAAEKLVRDSNLVSDLVATRDQLREALRSRAVIDQAKGIVMAHRHCTAEEAFQHLRRLSNTRKRKLREVAQELVDAARAARP
ncbi:ANTAR domain-containing protein [Spongisporangium articulatum]|uniref:ANTAR domain-containing protein n=1 Tax=Spongisporangium articulatum TaxID=3362603 RepID=A0ABW8ARY0_9ACTN